MKSFLQAASATVPPLESPVRTNECERADSASVPIKVAGMLFLIVTLGTVQTDGFAQTIPQGFSAYATLTTDYRFRGVSRTGGDPAIQGSADYTHPSGFFVGVWASTVGDSDHRTGKDFDGGEIDYYTGYGRNLGDDWFGSATLIRYAYVGEASRLDFDNTELVLAADFRDQLSGSLAYARYDSGDGSLAYELSARHLIANHFQFSARLGFNDLENIVGGRYLYWDLGVSKVFRHLTLDLRYSDSDQNAARLFGSNLTGATIVFSISVGS